MARAHAQLHRESLQAYAKKVYDGAVRAFRAQVTEDSERVLLAAMAALRAAQKLSLVSTPEEYEAAARAINWGLTEVNTLLRGRGRPEVKL